MSIPKRRRSCAVPRSRCPVPGISATRGAS